MLARSIAPFLLATILIGVAASATASTIHWGATDGIRGWDTLSDTQGIVLNNTGPNWSGLRIASHATQPDYVIWASSGGLRLWDTVSNSDVGFFNNTSIGDWAGIPITAHPSDPTLILYGTTIGIRIWDSINNVDLGVYNNATGDWANFGIALLPSDPTKIVFTNAGGGLDIWDTVANVSLGDFENSALGWGPSIGIEFLAVPEPGTATLFLAGLVGLGLRRRRSFSACG